jgi:hypothetical protein
VLTHPEQCPSLALWLMRVRLSCLLPCSVQRLVSELARPALLDYLSSPMLVFEPVEPPEPVERWSIGPYRFRLLVAGRLPIGEHVINVQRTVADPEEVGTSPVVWHDPATATSSGFGTTRSCSRTFSG